MADTGSFPIALDTAAAPGRSLSSFTKHLGDARTISATLLGMFLLGSGAAAAGIQYESEGYGALTIVGGAVIGLSGLVPLWLLFRRPSSPRR